MKKGWKYKPFCDVFPIKMGKTPPRGDASSWDTKKLSDNKWVSISDISQNEGKIIFDTKEYITDKAAQKIFRVKANSLLMSFKLTIGKMAFAGTDLYTNEAIIAIPENKEYNLKFLYFYLSSYNWSLLTDGNEKVKGKTLNKESIGQIKLPIISLPEQQRIVNYLDTQFAKIDQLKANAEKQLQAAKDLWQKALNKMLTPEKGWKRKSLLEITSKIGSGATPKGGKKVYLDKGCSLIRSLNVLHGKFKYEDLAHITNEAAELLKGVKIEENDVLFNITGASIARCCVVPHNVLPARVNQHVSILRINKETVNPYFICYLLLSEKHQKELLTIGESGATRQALTKTDLENHVVELPNIEKQNSIVETISHISKLVDNLKHNYDEVKILCNDLKQSLLRKIFE